MSTITKTEVTNFDILNEIGVCINGGCKTPVQKMIHGKRMGIEFYHCPVCGSMVTKNILKIYVKDPDKRVREKLSWVV